MITPLDILSIETWILIILGLVLIRLYIHKKWQYFKNLNIPHDPPSIRRLGHLADFFKDPDCIFNKDNEYMKKYGPIYGIYGWLSPSVVIGDPAILKHIFIKEFSNFSDRTRILTKVQGKELNSSILNLSGDDWKRVRHTLTPTFSGAKLKQMFGIIENCGDGMVNALKKEVDENDGRFLTKKIFSKFSLDVVCSAAFSANIHSQTDKKPKIVEMSEKAFQVSLIGSPILLLVFFFPWLERFLEKINYSMFPTDVLNFYRNLTDALIAQKKNATLKQRVDLMQLMLSSQVSEEEVKKGATKGLTRNEIVGNSFITILAGYENTANAMLFLAYNLAIHKSAQKKVKQEIEECIEQYGELTYDGINNMEYLTMCINESLRLYTPIGRNSRICDRDITINGFFIPKNMPIAIPVYGLAHDDEYWDEPFKFKPERMADMSQIDPMRFTPFGAGPRNCIGMRFALMEIKMGMCKLLQEFDLDVCSDTPEPPLQMTFVNSMKPKHDVYLKAIPCRS